MINTIITALKSRTVQTIIFTFVFNGFAAISGSLSAEVVTVGNLLLSALATYFRINPVQKY
jgi:hypothetical protein